MLEVREEDFLTLTGTPWVPIIRHWEAMRPLMLVAGSHGASGYQPLAPGSTTARLLVRSPVPLLVVPLRPPAPPREWPQEKIRTGQRIFHA